MCFQKTDCGTWLNCRQCWTPDGPVTVMDEWDPKFSTIVQTRYFLPDGTQTTTEPEDLYCTTAHTVAIYQVDSLNPLTIPENTAYSVSCDPSSEAEFDIAIGANPAVQYQASAMIHQVSKIESINGSRFADSIAITCAAGGYVNVIVVR